MTKRKLPMPDADGGEVQNEGTDWVRRLTRAQMYALRRIRDHGPGAWCDGYGRAGGAVSRMFNRMTKDGLCTPAPHKITTYGRQVLREELKRINA